MGLEGTGDAGCGVPVPTGGSDLGQAGWVTAVGMSPVPRTWLEGFGQGGEVTAPWFPADHRLSLIHI